MRSRVACVKPPRSQCTSMQPKRQSVGQFAKCTTFETFHLQLLLHHPLRAVRHGAASHCLDSVGSQGKVCYDAVRITLVTVMHTCRRGDPSAWVARAVLYSALSSQWRSSRRSHTVTHSHI